MHPSFILAYRRFLVNWIDGVRQYAVPVLLLSVLLSVASAHWVIENFRINTDTNDMISAELSFRKNSDALAKAFPQHSNNIVIAIDGQTQDLADDAALALGQELARQLKLFGDSLNPVGDPFFRTNGLLYMDLDELADMSDRLAEAQPFLGSLWKDQSLNGLFKMLSRAIDASLTSDGDAPIEIASIINSIAAVVKAQAENKVAYLSWHELMSGAGADEKPQDETYRRIIVIQPALDFGSLQPASRAISGIRKLVRTLGLDADHGIRVRLTGSAALAQDELKSVEEGLGLAGILSVVLVIGFLFWGLRSKRLVLAIIITLFVGLLWTAAFAVWMIGAFNLISVAFAVLFIGLSVDFGIHFGLRYAEGIDAGLDHQGALKGAAEGVGGALTLCAVAAAIGFFSFLPTDYRGLAELGLIAGSGMFIALIANLTILPAMLTMTRIDRREAATVSLLVENVRQFLLSRSRQIVWGAVVVGMVAASMVPFARFDFDPLNLKDAKSESVSALLDIARASRTGPYSITIMMDDLDGADAMAVKLNRLDVVSETRTLSNYIPGDQEEKLELIGTMALYIGPSLSATGSLSPPGSHQRRAAYQLLNQKLEKLDRSTDPATVKAAENLITSFKSLFNNKTPEAQTLTELEMRLLKGLPGRLHALRDSLNAEPVTLETLPLSLARREVAADGRARLKVYPQEDLTDRHALARFVKDVRRVAPQATGSPVVILEAGDAVVNSFFMAGSLAVTLIALLLLALLKSVRDVLLVFAPLVLAALLTVAASVVLTIPFNFANVIVLPLLFGLGVAGGVHIVARERKGDIIGGVLATSTPRAVVFSALTTIGSFGSMALSGHPGTSSMGVLLTVAITLTLFSTLLVLPALMRYVGAEGKSQ